MGLLSKFLKHVGCLIVTVLSLLCISVLILYDIKHTMRAFKNILRLLSHLLLKMPAIVYKKEGRDEKISKWILGRWFHTLFFQMED